MIGLHLIGILGVLLILFCVATDASFLLALYGVCMVGCALMAIGPEEPRP